MEIQDHLERKAHLDHQVSKVHLDPLEVEEKEVKKEHLVKWDLLDLEEDLVTKDPPERLE